MADMTLNEIGAWCAGWKYELESGTSVEGELRSFGWWIATDGEKHGSLELPDITIGDPITDAQYGNVMRLREKAIAVKKWPNYWSNLATNLEEDDGGFKGHQETEVLITEAPLEQIRDAAIDTLIADTPPEVQEAWGKMNE